MRNLAQRSATSAKEIKSLIGDTLQKVADGSVLVNTSGEKLREIVGSVKRVTVFVGQIASATDEQASGIDQVNRAVSQMDQVVQNNSAQTEELSATAEELASQADGLRRLVEKFKLGDESAPAETVSAASPQAAEPRAGAGRVRSPSPRRAATSRLTSGARVARPKASSNGAGQSIPPSFEAF